MLVSKWLLGEASKEEIENKDEDNLPNEDEISSKEDKEPKNKSIEDEDAEEEVDTKEEIIEALDDMNEDELEALLDIIYLIILGEDEESEENNEPSEEDKKVTEAMIQHLTGKERSEGKMMRRTPKWKKKAKVRYIKNKKCPAGTTWSSKTRSCTKLNLDMSRLQKILAKMKIKG